MVDVARDGVANRSEEVKEFLLTVHGSVCIVQQKNKGTFFSCNFCSSLLLQCTGLKSGTRVFTR